jgi:hypothetical protein
LGLVRPLLPGLYGCFQADGTCYRRKVRCAALKGKNNALKRLWRPLARLGEVHRQPAHCLTLHDDGIAALEDAEGRVLWSTEETT